MLAVLKAWPADAGDCRTASATAILDDVCARGQWPTTGRDEETGLEVEPRNWTGRGDRGTLIPHNRTREVPRLPPDRPSTQKRTTDVLQKPDIFKSY